MLKDLLERNTNKKLFRSWIKGLIPGILLIITSSCAKANNPDSLFKIADDVVEQCRFDLPDSNIVPELSEYNLWMYANFMIMEGMDALGEVSGNEQYKTYTARNIDFFADLQSKYGDSL